MKTYLPCFTLRRVLIAMAVLGAGSDSTVAFIRHTLTDCFSDPWRDFGHELLVYRFPFPHLYDVARFDGSRVPFSNSTRNIFSEILRQRPLLAVEILGFDHGQNSGRDAPVNA